MRIIIEFDARELGSPEQPEVKVKTRSETGTTAGSTPDTDAGPAPGTRDETHSELPGETNESGWSSSEATPAGSAPDLSGL